MYIQYTLKKIVLVCTLREAAKNLVLTLKPGGLELNSSRNLGRRKKNIFSFGTTFTLPPP